MCLQYVRITFIRHHLNIFFYNWSNVKWQWHDAASSEGASRGERRWRGVLFRGCIAANDPDYGTTDMEELDVCITNEWYKSTNNYCFKQIDSMPTRIRAVTTVDLVEDLYIIKLFSIFNKTLYFNFKPIYLVVASIIYLNTTNCLKLLYLLPY